MTYTQYINNLRKIDQFCRQYGIKNYIINSDCSINVNGTVNLAYKRYFRAKNDIVAEPIRFIPIMFNIIYGDFDISGNDLQSLANGPRIVTGKVNCSRNRIKKIERLERVGYLDISDNGLTTLVGCPIISDKLDARNNRLTNFIGCPPNIEVDAGDNTIRSLKGLSTNKNVNVSKFYLPDVIRSHRNPHIVDKIIRYQNDYSIWGENDKLNTFRFEEMMVDINADMDREFFEWRRGELSTL
jgi:hypothetical protein